MARVHCRTDQCSEALVLTDQCDWVWSIVRWITRSQAYAKLGRPDLARDRYAAASEWITKYQIDFTPWVTDMMQEAYVALALPNPWPPADRTTAQYLAVYDRLIATSPRSPWLYNRRAVCHGRLGD